MQRLHHDEVPIDVALAQRLVAAEHPQFTDRPVRALATQGTDNVVFRLGDDHSLRLPRKPSAVPSLIAELDWLPRLAPHLPMPVPEPVARQYIYHHPADTPLQGLRVRESGPVPGIQEPDLDHFIRPDGIFNDTQEDHSHCRLPPIDDSDSDGFSLSDIPWPIPDRRKPTEG